ncbi:hypothetical protein BSYN_03850 [Bacteroides sedimenti]|uniref:CopG family transcriptional regulator n=1 Tax=Bacteroides sedimenti TaxID=2136147 RepID=A0ABM8IF73_9BACE
MKRKGMRRIVSRISLEKYERLERVRKKHGFKSIYQIVAYLIDCFLRATDPREYEDPVHDEIKLMFREVAGWSDCPSP